MIEGTLIGRLGKDAELRTVGDHQVLVLSVASSDYNSKKQAFETTWVRVNWWGKTAEQQAQRFLKGDEIIAIGSFKEGFWTTKEGGTAKRIECNASKVRLATSKKPHEVNQNQSQAPQYAQNQQYQQQQTSQPQQQTRSPNQGVNWSNGNSQSAYNTAPDLDDIPF